MLRSQNGSMMSAREKKGFAMSANASPAAKTKTRSSQSLDEPPDLRGTPTLCGIDFGPQCYDCAAIGQCPAHRKYDRWKLYQEKLSQMPARCKGCGYLMYDLLDQTFSCSSGSISCHF